MSPALWVSPDTGIIAVGIYAPVAEAKKAPSILLDAKDLSELRREAAYGKAGGAGRGSFRKLHITMLILVTGPSLTGRLWPKCCCENRGNLRKTGAPTVRVQRHGRGGVQVEHMRLTPRVEPTC